MGTWGPKQEKANAKAAVESARQAMAGIVNGENERHCAALTETEMEVLALMLQGSGDKQIADARKCDLTTIQTHLKHIRQKFESHSRTGVTATFILNTLLQLCDDDTRNRILGILNKEGPQPDAPPVPQAPGKSNNPSAGGGINDENNHKRCLTSSLVPSPCFWG